MKPVSAILTVLMVLSSSLHAGSVPDVAHLVSIEDLKNEISARNVERAGNIREIQSLLRAPEVQKLGHLFDLEQIETVIPKLDDTTLARLADEGARINEQIRAGHLCGTNWTLVITYVATMAMVVLLILVATR